MYVSIRDTTKNANGWGGGGELVAVARDSVECAGRSTIDSELERCECVEN